MSGGDWIFLIAAGALAGLVASAGGIMSLISYPALLAVGLNPLAANIANNVSGAATLGSVLGSRSELSGRGVWLRRWMPICGAGGACGAALLLLTPSDVFEQIVPYLVASGALALMVQPRVTAWHRRRGGESTELMLALGLFLVAVYTGYFGAGSGIMTLTLMLLLVSDRLPIANALKNVLIGVATGATGVVLVIFGTVAWSAVVPLSIGLVIGSRFGPVLARTIPQNLLRWLIVMLGFGLAIKLWIAP